MCGIKKREREREREYYNPFSPPPPLLWMKETRENLVVD